MIAALVIVSMARATFDDGPPRTTEEQVQAIASTLKCPICGSQSVADSDVAASRAIRLEIAKLVEEGESASTIRAQIADTYGDQVQLIPPASGFAGLVWILPVVAVVVALRRAVRRVRPVAAHARGRRHRRGPCPGRTGAARAVSDPTSSGLAPLEEQRDFLLRSLDDLEREHDAGDVDEADYQALKDDYTARAAAVLRSLEDGQVAPAAVARPPIGRRVAAILGVVAFAGLAGLLVAQASGRRDAGDLSSGDIRASVTEKLNEAGQLLSDGDAAGAVELYDEVLQDQPANAEALTYRGWALYQFLGQPEDGLSSLLDAATADREYPDPHAFLAILFYRGGLIEQAANELDRLEAARSAARHARAHRRSARRDRRGPRRRGREHHDDHTLRPGQAGGGTYRPLEI